MILGFGIAEETKAHLILHECFDDVTDFEAVENRVKQFEKDLMAISETQKLLPRGECLERYTYFFPSIHRIHDKLYVYRITMHHINRNHALSSDGWGLMITKWCVVLENYGTPKAVVYKEVM